MNNLTMQQIARLNVLYRKYCSMDHNVNASRVHAAVLSAKREAEAGIYPVTAGLIRELRAECREAAILAR